MIRTTIALIVSAVVCSAGPVTYIVNQTVGTKGSVTGSIETDGTLGAPLEEANFLDWNLVLSNGTDTSDLQGPLSGSDSTLFVLDGPSGSDFTATPTQLFFNFSDTGDGFAIFQQNAPGVPYWCLQTSIACTGRPAGQELAVTNADITNLNASGTQTFSPLSGSVVIGSVSPVSEVGSPDPVVTPAPAATPEPSTLSFLGLGFAALGFWKYRAARRVA